jgi:hypothetical protein
VASRAQICIVVLGVLVLAGTGCQSQPKAPADAWLLTPEEAAELSLTAEELTALLALPPIVLRSTEPGPRVVLLEPPAADPVDRLVRTDSPTDLVIDFEQSASPVDMDTLEVKARKGVLSRNITDRVRPYVTGTRIEATDLELPSGRFRIEVSIADADGARTVAEYRLVVGD